MATAATTSSSVSIHCCWSQISRLATDRSTRALPHRPEPEPTLHRFLHRRRHQPLVFSAATRIPLTPQSTPPAPCSARLTQLPAQSRPLPVAEFRPEVTSRVTWPRPVVGDPIPRCSRSSTSTRVRSLWDAAATATPTTTMMTSLAGIPEVEWDARPVVRWALHPLSSQHSTSVTIERNVRRRRGLSLVIQLESRDPIIIIIIIIILNYI